MIVNLGAGYAREPGITTLDKRPLPGIDIVHDLENIPWPLPDESCELLWATHIIEHIKPWLTIDFFNEMWRILKPGGEVFISTPLAGSPEFWNDPTHCNGFTEHTFRYFDPTFTLYETYKPRPWQMKSLNTEKYLTVTLKKASING